MKYYVFLAGNCLLLWMLLMFFADNGLLPQGVLPRIRYMALIIVFLTAGYNLVTIYIVKTAAPETGLLYKTLTVVSTTAGRVANYVLPFKKELFTYSLIALGLIIIGLLLMGMPGALLLELPAKLGFWKSLSGDAAWPAAILLSILWPLCLPIAVFLKYWLHSKGYTLLSGTAPVYSLVLGIPVFTGLVYFLSK